MRKYFVLCRNLAAVVLTVAFVSQAAHAFVDPPVLVTTNPVTTHPVLISITAGVCDAVAGDPYPPPAVTRNGTNIRMVVWTVTSLDPEECFYDTGAVTLVVGTFPIGSYVLQVDRMYLGGGGPVTETIGTLTFTVSAPAAAPALSAFSVSLLALLLLGAAYSAFRRGMRGALLLMLAPGATAIRSNLDAESGGIRNAVDRGARFQRRKLDGSEHRVLL